MVFNGSCDKLLAYRKLLKRWQCNRDLNNSEHFSLSIREESSCFEFYFQHVNILFTYFVCSNFHKVLWHCQKNRFLWFIWTLVIANFKGRWWPIQTVNSTPIKLICLRNAQLFRFRLGITSNVHIRSQIFEPHSFIVIPVPIFQSSSG